MAWIFLLLSLVGVRLTANAFRPKHAPARRAFASFVAGWFMSELPLHHIVVQAVVTAVFLRAGVAQSFPGRLGLALTILSWGGLWLCHRRSRKAEEVIERALRDGLGPDYRGKILPEIAANLASGVSWKRILVPFPIRPAEIERVRDLRYRRISGLNLKLDLYRRRSPAKNRPVLLEIHGGGWVIGNKGQQGIPLMLRMASQGWLCVSVDYRLSPHATFPDPLIDLKHALRWIREQGREYGADPDFIVVTGQSAGGHLASLVALTADDPELQPGFEDVETRVAGCVSFYGVYDFIDRHDLWAHDGLARLLEKHVMKASLSEARASYEKASPMSLVRADAPPFLVIHGDLDSLVPVEEARRFVSLLRGCSRAPVLYAEIPGAQHAFELFSSLRAELVLGGVERFLAVLYSQHLASRKLSKESLPAAAS